MSTLFLCLWNFSMKVLNHMPKCFFLWWVEWQWLGKQWSCHHTIDKDRKWKNSLFLGDHGCIQRGRMLLLDWESGWVTHTNTVMLEKAASQPPAARLHLVTEALPSPISRKTEETVNHRVSSTPPRCFQLQPALNVKSIIGQPLTNHIMSWPESAMADVTKKKKKKFKRWNSSQLMLWDKL